MANRKRIVMWGASDQGRVNEPIIRDCGGEIVALVDHTDGLEGFLPQVQMLRGKAALEAWLKNCDSENLYFVVAIANPFGHIRVQLHEYLIGLGMTPFTVRDRSSYVAESARLGLGNQLMPMSVVHTAAVIHDQCIVNTGAIVDAGAVVREDVPDFTMVAGVPARFVRRTEIHE